MTHSESTAIVNEALWMRRGSPRLEVGPAPYTRPGEHEIVVRARALAVNPVDAMAGPAYLLVTPWLRYPAVIGCDVAGEVVEVGSAVTRFAAGDRVLGHPLGLEKAQNRPAEGAYQRYVVLHDHMASAIPDSLSFAQAVVLPLTLSTAATGLFQQDHLGLALPTSDPTPRHEVVLVWGAGTGVGMNAVQLANNAGYDVVATASARSADLVRSLGADEVVDRTAADAARRIAERIGDRRLAAALAIGAGSFRPTVEVAASTNGSHRVACAAPDPVTRLRGRLARRRGVTVSHIWGGSLSENEVGGAIYRDFLPGALESGAYRAEPVATVVGDGLAALPGAFRRMKGGGVAATKLVVTL